MAIYQWKGRTRQGSLKKGEIEAVNEAAVMAQLRAQMLLPVSVKEKSKDVSEYLPFLKEQADSRIIMINTMSVQDIEPTFGAYAASMVENGQTVIIDVGSTTTELAHALSPELLRVVVITNGLNIALGLESQQGISVIVTGGTLRPLQHSLVAPMGTILLEKLKADIAFLGCNGVEPARGFTNANIAEAEIKQAMVRSAEKVVFLADHDKIGAVASAFVADISCADLLITDTGADPSTLAKLRSEGLKIVTADPGSG